VLLDCVIYCAFYSILFEGGRFFPVTVYISRAYVLLDDFVKRWVYDLLHSIDISCRNTLQANRKYRLSCIATVPKQQHVTKTKLNTADDMYPAHKKPLLVSFNFIGDNDGYCLRNII